MKADRNTSSTHPLLPPTKEENRIQWLRLLRSRRVGVATFFRLMQSEGNAEAALEKLPQLAQNAGLRDYAPCRCEDARIELARARKMGVRPVFFGEPYYPKKLSQITDAPPILWCKGKIETLQRRSVAIVGARNASSLGLRMARQLSGALNEAGYVVVSGLARGIDTATHEQALTHGTVAVLAGGVDIIYPDENQSLARDILQNGALISEAPLGKAPQARHFPARNRIISGLVDAVIVVEAAAKSGSLITARLALEQGREVLAIPGHPMDARAAGANMLIRDGAALVRNVEDIFEIIGKPERPISPRNESAEQATLPLKPPLEKAPPMRGFRETISLHQRILARLGPHPTAEDQVLRDLKVSHSDMADALLDLELEAKVERRAGGLLSLLPFQKRARS